MAIDPDFCNWDLDTDTLESIPSVQALCLSTASFDYVNSNVIKELGIPLINVPGFNTDSVAEYALCMAIETARKLPMVIKNDWKPVGLTEPFLLRGKTAGVVGMGRVGTRIAEVLNGIGMEVVYWSKHTEDDRFRRSELHDVFAEADLVIPALAVNEETKQLITHAILDSMKSSAIMVGINRVRELWDEDYVIRKVEAGELAGYSYEGAENGGVSDHAGNILALPHISWMTKDSMENLERIWVENILSVIEGNPQNAVA